MSTKHTPTPYYAAESSGGYAIRVSSVTLGKLVHYDVTVAVLSCDPLTTPQAKETAEFMARACNCHDELVEALKLATYSLAWHVETQDNGRGMDSMHLARARAILAKAPR